MKNLIICAGIFAATLLSAVSASAQSSKLFIYRKGCIYGALEKYQINVDGTNKGRIKNNQVREFPISSGSHTVTGRQPKRSVTFNVENGQNYVVVYKIRFGLLGGRPKLKVMTESMAKEKYKKFDEHMGMKKTR